MQTKRQVPYRWSGSKKTWLLLELCLAVWPSGVREVHPAFIQQLTSTPADFSSSSPAISADGSRVAFESDADLTGENPDHFTQIFVINTDGTGLIQLTHGGSSSFAPSLSADGARVAFLSFADLTGENPDFSTEVFVANTDGTGILQLTHFEPSVVSEAHTSEGPSLSGDGLLVAFTLTIDREWVAELPGPSARVFVANTDGTDLSPLTPRFLRDVGVLAGSPLSLSANGSRVAFNSGLGLHVIDTDGTNLTQLVQGTVFSPSISEDGSRVAFFSSDDLTGENRDRNSEVFLINMDGTGLTQLTDGGGFSPSLSGDGVRVAFLSSADLTGENPDGSTEVFVANVDGTELGQLTSTPLVKIGPTPVAQFGPPSLSGDGLKVAVGSAADLTGENFDGSEEIFIITIDDP
jgi:Tol biopolymer transport system component